MGWCGDNSFGPFETLPAANDNLTNCFVESIVVFVPVLLFILFFFFRLFTIDSKREFSPSKYDETQSQRLNFLHGDETGKGSKFTGEDMQRDAQNLFKGKVFGSIVMAVLFLVQGLIRIVTDDYAGAIDGYLVIIPLVTAFSWILCAILIYVEYSRIRYSKIIAAWWCATLLSAALKLRVEIDRISYSDDVDNNNGNGGDASWDADMYLFMATFGLLVYLTYLEFGHADERAMHVHDIEKSISGTAKEQEECPEIHASFFSRITFSWVSDLMELGYTRPLEISDTWKINPGDDSHSIHKKITQQRTIYPNSFLRVINGVFGLYFSSAAIFKFVHDCMAFVGPLVLERLIEFIEDPSINVSDGYVYVLVILVSASIQTFSLHQYFHICMRTGMLLRSGVATAVYQKSLLLSGPSRQSTSTGAIVNLMTIDAQRFMDVTTYIHMLWSSILQVTLSLYFLYQVVGVSLFAGVGVILISIPLNFFLAKKLRTINVELLKLKDQRGKMINEVLSGIKVLKLYAWETPVIEQVRQAREKELAQLKYAKYVNSVVGFFWSSIPVLVSVVTFITYVATGGELTTSKAFTALALFNILRFPLTMFPQMITALMEVLVSVQRLDDFFCLPELDSEAVLRSKSLRKKTGSNDDGRDDNNVDNNVGDGNKKIVVSVKNGIFSWSGKENEVVLHDINFEAGVNELVAIIGQVGSGKSSLMSAINGEMTKVRTGYDSNSFVTIRGSVAWVSQQAWIINASLRDNITFGKKYDEEWYNLVVKNCALLPDFEILPNGDQTEIGEKGINLSGGQKQRVSIARAVYQRADIYLFDDPLSALDAHVAAHIFENIIGPHGMLNDTCRILVTHGINFLPECDAIYCMEKGKIAEYGSYKTLIETNGVLAGLTRVFKETAVSNNNNNNSTPLSTSQTDDANSSSNGSTPTPTTSRPSTPSVTHKKNVVAAASLAKNDKSISTSKSTTNDDKKSTTSNKSNEVASKKIIIEEERAFGSVDSKVYTLYISSLGVFMAFVVISSMILQQTAYVGSNFWLSIWTSEVSDEEYIDYETNDVDNWYYLGIYVGLSGVYCLLVFVSSVAVALAGLASARRIHDSMLVRVIRAPMSFYDTTPIGRILNRFLKDQYVIDDILPRTISGTLGTLFSVLGVIVVIAIATPYFIAVMLPLALVYRSVQIYYLRASRELKRLESVTRSPIYSHFSETLNGVTTIRAYGFQKMFIQQNYDKIDLNQMTSYPSIVSNRWLAVRLEFVGTFISTFAALFCVMERGSIDAGLAGLSISYALSVTQTLNWLVRSSCETEANIVSVERTIEYSEMATEAPAVIANNRPSKNWPSSGAIEFRDVELSYRKGLPLVLKGMNISIRGSEKIGICGRTGAGKSSFALALFRLVECSAGQIFIDGIDIAKIGLDDLRSKLSIIPQDPVIFAGTVRYNLDPFKERTDEQIWQALESSHMANVIKNLEGKLDGKVSENGENFSVGQRQLLCLTRALLRRSKILVLDEATSSIDVETDKLVQETIRIQFADCTVIVIAHRLNTLMSCDSICVLSDGVVVEKGTPANLVNDPDSIFKSMLESLTSSTAVAASVDALTIN